MANRYTLHVKDLERFKKYLDIRNIEHRDKKIKYQVLQVKIDGRFHPIYAKDKTCRGNEISHYTIPKTLEPLVKSFIKSKKRSL